MSLGLPCERCAETRRGARRRLVQPSRDAAPYDNAQVAFAGAPKNTPGMVTTCCFSISSSAVARESRIPSTGPSRKTRPTGRTGVTPGIARARRTRLSRRARSSGSHRRAIIRLVLEHRRDRPLDRHGRADHHAVLNLSTPRRSPRGGAIEVAAAPACDGIRLREAADDHDVVPPARNETCRHGLVVVRKSQVGFVHEHHDDVRLAHSPTMRRNSGRGAIAPVGLLGVTSTTARSSLDMRGDDVVPRRHERAVTPDGGASTESPPPTHSPSRG